MKTVETPQETSSRDDALTAHQEKTWGQTRQAAPPSRVAPRSHDGAHGAHDALVPDDQQDRNRPRLHPATAVVLADVVGFVVGVIAWISIALTGVDTGDSEHQKPYLFFLAFVSTLLLAGIIGRWLTKRWRYASIACFGLLLLYLGLLIAIALSDARYSN